MKRSEAVSLIHSIVYNDPFNDDIAIIILDELEKAGMLPPFVDQYESDTSLDLIGNRWESEDEEK